MKAKKRFGQNFLTDKSIIERIISAIGPRHDEHIVEIGPGRGALTEYLQPGLQRLDVIEIDRDCVAYLQQKFSAASNLVLHAQDVLEFDFKELWQQMQPVATAGLRIVGNLPYNISTPLLFHIFKQACIVQDMHFMLQREVVQRLCAEPGSKQYGRLSIMAQYYCRIQALFEVPPNAFSPQPKVVSAIVSLQPHANPPYSVHNWQLFVNMVRQVFTQRRKTLHNALKSMVGSEGLVQIKREFDLTRRPQQVSGAEYAALANLIHTISES